MEHGMNLNDPITTKIFKAKDIIMEEGEKGHYVYLIISGSVDILQTKNGGPELVATMSSGDILGEMGILTNEPRSATAIAREDSKVVMIRDHTLHSALLNDKLPIIKPLTKQLVLRCKGIEKENNENLLRVEKLEKEVLDLKSQLLQYTLAAENPVDEG